MTKDEGLFSQAFIHRQTIACRRNKRNTVNALRFEARQELNLLELRDALAERSYEPERSVSIFCRATEAARDLRRRFPRPRGAPCAGEPSGKDLGAGVHP